MVAYHRWDATRTEISTKTCCRPRNTCSQCVLQIGTFPTPSPALTQTVACAPAAVLSGATTDLLCAQDTDELLSAVRKVQARRVETEDDILAVRCWRKVAEHTSVSLSSPCLRSRT